LDNQPIFFLLTISSTGSQAKRLIPNIPIDLSTAKRLSVGDAELKKSNCSGSFSLFDFFLYHNQF